MAPPGGTEVDKGAQAGPEQEGGGSPAGANNLDNNEGADSTLAAEQDGNAIENQNNVDPGQKKDQSSRLGSMSPTQSGNHYPYPAHLTPQQPGYYLPYQQPQVTPEPPSPAGPGATAVYDVGSFFQQPGAGAFHNSPFPGGAAAQQYVNQHQHQHPPLSPSQNNSGSMGSIPPASPLFPRITGQATAGLLDQHRFDASIAQQRGAPLSPAPPYLSPQVGPTGAPGAAMYANMSAYATAVNGTSNSNSPDEFQGWSDNRNPQNSAYQHNSPQISAHGIPIPFVPGMPHRSVSGSGRSYSFEESMLPPSAIAEQQNQLQQEQNHSYASYASNQNNLGGTQATLFTHQQPWGYGPPPQDMYNASASQLQPRPTPMPYGGVAAPPARHHAPPHMAPYGGHFYPATSPGPPIQTTASNKGPDGANLFIFHIPNHFTNLDMYQLFSPYGNLLSVRIMVEKDTGRSRGFGFVSYDSPDAAALAIKELNGFAIGNKRLKVQHKQIRPSDQHDRNHSNNHHGAYDMGPGGSFGRGHLAPSLPPSGPMAMSNSSWFNRQAQGAPPGVDGQGPPDQDQQQSEDINTGSAAAPPNSGTPDAPGGESAAAPLASPLSSLDPLRQSLPDVGAGSGE